MMEQMKEIINGKFFEIGALIILKNKGLLEEKEYLKIKKDIEREYFINVRLDFKKYN